MTTPVGTAVMAARWALVDALAERPGLAGVRILGGPPSDALDVDTGGRVEGIWVESSNTDADTPTQRSGNVPVEESATHVLVAQVVWEVTLDDEVEQRSCEQRAVDLVSEVVDEVRSNPTLGLGTADGFAHFHIVCGGVSLPAGNSGWFAAGEAFGVRFEITLRHLARIHS